MTLLGEGVAIAPTAAHTLAICQRDGEVPALSALDRAHGIAADKAAPVDAREGGAQFGFPPRHRCAV